MPDDVFTLEPVEHDPWGPPAGDPYAQLTADPATGVAYPNQPLPANVAAPSTARNVASAVALGDMPANVTSPAARLGYAIAGEPARMLRPIVQGIPGAVLAPGRITQDVMEEGYRGQPLDEQQMAERAKELAGYPMTGGFAGVPLRAGEVALGAGPVRRVAAEAAADRTGSGVADAAEAYPGIQAHAAWISQRFPTAVNATEDPIASRLTIGPAPMQTNPQAWEKNVALVKGYPNMLPQETSGSTDQTAENFINHIKQNLLYLYDNPQVAQWRDRAATWYDGANNIAQHRADYYGMPLQSSAAVYAALSPQKDWYQNASLGDRVMHIFHAYPNQPFTPEMLQTAQRIFADPKYAQQVKDISSQTLSSAASPAEKAMWLRIFDQTYNDPSYHIVTPEGGYGPLALNADGRPSRVAWGSLPEIGKAISAIESNGDPAVISQLMGMKHKVRNFYNNILDPNSPMGDTTVDTHAVAGGLLRPLSGQSVEVAHNFGNYPGKGIPAAAESAINGVSGLYGLYAEAYRRAAAERGILPRQMQSITWEASRGLFPDTFKTAKNAAAIDDIWRARQIGDDPYAIRNAIVQRAGGIRSPEWAGAGP